MQRAKLIIPFFKLLFIQPAVILKALYHAVTKTDRKNYVIKKYGMELGLPQVDILTLFPNMNESIENYTHLYGTSMPIDIAVLKMLAKRFKDCEYLEIGTWRGESISNVATVAKTCTSVSLSAEEMNKIGFDEKFTRVQRFFSKGIQNITHIEENSRKFDFESLNKKFDLIFIDGDHSYDGVKNDTEKMFELLKDKNSVIVWHDYTTSYEHIDWEVFAGILDGTPKDERSKLYQISNSYCAIYTSEKFATKQLDYPTYPDKKFKITIEASKL